MICTRFNRVALVWLLVLFSGVASLAQTSSPPAATALSASPGYYGSSVWLAWNAVSGAYSYNVYRSTTPGGEGGIPVATNVWGNGGYVDAGLADGTTYYYTVTAVNDSGEGAASNEASATPGTSQLPGPVGLKAVAGSGQVSLVWRAVGGATSYNLYRYQDGSNSNWLLYQVGLTSASYTDSGLTNGTTYEYYVCAVSQDGEGYQGNYVSAIPGSTPPAAPTGLRASPSYYGSSVWLTWNPVGGAYSYNVSYNIYRSTTPGGEGSIPIATNVWGYGSYTDSGLANGTTYYYRVVAVTDNGEGGASNEASATPGTSQLPGPVGLKAVAGDSQISLAWRALSGATSYNLYRYQSGTDWNWTLYQVGLSGTTYTDSGLTDGATYEYYVCAVSQDGEGYQSDSVSAVPGSTPPAAPTGLAATVSYYGSGVTLTWNPVGGANSYNVSYNVYRSTTPGGEGSAPVATNVWDGYTDNNLTNGTTYYYTVTAVNEDGEGAASNEASATPGVPPLPWPVGLKAVAGNAQIGLAWQPVAGATSYNLYRYQYGVDWNWMLYQVGLAGTTYTDSGLTDGTTYEYYVCAVNKDGEGDQSNEVSAVPGSTPLAPTKLAATAGNGQVSLTWNPVNNAYSYNVYRSTTPGGEGSAPVATGWNGYTDSGLTNGTTYYYTVTAVNEDGEGAASNEASATPSVPPLPAPALSATAASGQASLTWTAVAGASSYNLYRYGGGNDWNWTLLQVGLTSTSDTDTGLTDGTTYQYSVCAVSKDGQGSQSNQVSVLPGGPALALAAHVVWTRDYTASPPTQTASTAGTFGGNATLHLTLTGPQTLGWGGAATATVRVHEVAAPDASGDLVWTDVPLYGSPSAACGEPSASPPAYSTQCYLDEPWNAGGFNGAYTVTATVQATVGGSATPQTVTLSSPLTLDREDLLITGTSPANPTPLLWDPSANNGSPSPLTVSATLNPVAYRAGGTATLKVYAVDPQNPNETPVRTLTQPFVTTGGQVTFSWDGTGQPTTANGVTTPGLQQPHGLYLFRIFVSDTTGILDTDKSPYLSLYNPAPSAQFLSDDGTTTTFSDGYTLTSSDNPAQSASAGEIDVYDSTLTSIFTQALGGSDLTPGAHSGQLSVTSSQNGGLYGFVLSAQDNDAGHDRGHRARYVNHLITLPLQITTQSLPAATVGQPYSQTFHGIGGDGNYVWTLNTEDNQPDGLDITGSGFSLSGTPTTAGNYTLVVTLQDTSGHSCQKTFALTVNPAPALQIITQTLPSGIPGQAYSAQMQASGGYGEYTWSLTGTDTPEGLYLSADGGITGVPDAEADGGDSPELINFTVVDESGQSATVSIPNPIWIPDSDTTPSSSNTDLDPNDFFAPWGVADYGDFNVNDNFPYGSSVALREGQPHHGVKRPLVLLSATQSQHSMKKALRRGSRLGCDTEGNWVECVTDVSYEHIFAMLDNLRSGGGGLIPASKMYS